MNKSDIEKTLSLISTKLLNEKGYICMIDVFIELGYLSEQDVESWRMKRIPYLEKCIKVNLGKISFIVKTIRDNCLNGNLKESYTSYRSWGKGSKIVLQFSKSGKPSIEQLYTSHFLNRRN